MADESRPRHGEPGAATSGTTGQAVGLVPRIPRRTDNAVPTGWGATYTDVVGRHRRAVEDVIALIRDHRARAEAPL